jgi:aspartate-semialdehyde dehydrogenase
MKLGSQGYCVAVVGASSLLGKELLAVLEERNFPVSRLVKFESDEEEPDLPIVDLREDSEAAISDQQVPEQDLDLAFLVAAGHPHSALPTFLRPRPSAVRPPALRSNGGAMAESGAAASPAPITRCVVIDMADAGGAASGTGLPGRVLSVPFLDHAEPGERKARERVGVETDFIVSPHPATILISSLLLRIAAHFPLERAVANAFGPASEIGAKGIEELQKQTVNLLSFQKIPRSVFGAQLAFNVLPRLGRVEGNALSELEAKVRRQLRELLSGRIPLPAVRIFQVPVFYSLAVSLYVETTSPVDPQAFAEALEKKPIRLRRLSDLAPSQVEATGSGDILVDTIVPDPNQPRGVWIWAVADNMRLAAVNAVEVAESLRERLDKYSLSRRGRHKS